jgi:hypothetical protein
MKALQKNRVYSAGVFGFSEKKTIVTVWFYNITFCIYNDFMITFQHMFQYTVSTCEISLYTRNHQYFICVKIIGLFASCRQTFSN